MIKKNKYKASIYHDDYVITKRLDKYCNITHLVFSSNFNDIDNLPMNLTHLIFGDEFNKNIDDIPNSVVYLKLGYSFNQKINKLPKQSLSVAKQFEKSSLTLIIWNDYAYINDLLKLCKNK